MSLNFILDEKNFFGEISRRFSKRKWKFESYLHAEEEDRGNQAESHAKMDSSLPSSVEKEAKNSTPNPLCNKGVPMFSALTKKKQTIFVDTCKPHKGNLNACTYDFIVVKSNFLEKQSACKPAFLNIYASRITYELDKEQRR